jgi:hypothetical protein
MWRSASTRLSLHCSCATAAAPSSQSNRKYEREQAGLGIVYSGDFEIIIGVLFVISLKMKDFATAKKIRI